MKVNQYGAPASLQNAKLLAVDSSGTYGVPMEDVKKHMFGGGGTLVDVVKELILASHPVGSIEVNTTGANPSTYLGGTWVAWGSGRVPVGVNANDGDFNTTEKTGGVKSYTHQHVVGNHAHTINDHAHSINSHAHSINAHSHTVNDHFHTIPSHSHTVNSHNHTQTMRFQSAYLEAAGGGVKYTNGESVPTSIIYTGSASPGTSGVELTTTQNTARTSGVGLTTNGSGAINTNGCGALTSNGSGDLATTSAGNSSLQPYITCYMWKRTK